VTGTPAPVLPTQQAQWEAYRRDPSRTTFGIEVVLHIDGDLDVALLAAALDVIRRTQPALRATFHDGPGGDAVQVIHPEPVGPPLGRADVRDEQDRPAAARRLVTAFANTPFDLGRGPVLHALLVHVGAREHVLAVSLPRLVVDGWSLGLLTGDLERTYRALVAGEAAPVSDRTADYLACCADRSATDPDRAVARYADWISGVPRLRLPTDFPSPAHRSTEGAEVRVELDQAESDRITAAARRHRTTPFPVLFAAFASVLGARSGQDRFLLNAYTHGRRRPHEEQVIGRFASLVPLPVDLSGDTSPAALVRGASRTWWHSFDHPTTPMPALARRVEPDRPARHLPFCDVGFQFNTPEPEPAAGEPRFRRVRQPSTFSPNDLTLFVGPSLGGRFELRLEYRTDLYREETAWRLLRDYQAVLTELSAPDLVEAEQEQVP
jgi:hypothetical protein